MFRSACEVARNFTRPVVLSRRTFNDQCTGGIGAFVVLNEEGWILTAFHILEQIRVGNDAAAIAVRVAAEADAIRADGTLTPKARQKAIGKLAWPGRDETKNFSAWWGINGCSVVDTHAVPAVDLGIGRLEPFDRAWVSVYPTLKDPSKNFEGAGVSLCKIGFPFNSISPTWDDAKKGFDLPIGGGLPLFPIEGILARHIIIDPASVPGGAPWPLRWIETSSPGLRGQSGGPVFDTDGTVWAIQVNTMSYPLGFDIPGAKGEQYFHAGRGVSVATIVPILDSLKINYRMSAN